MVRAICNLVIFLILLAPCWILSFLLFAAIATLLAQLGWVASNEGMKLLVYPGTFFLTLISSILSTSFIVSKLFAKLSSKRSPT